MNNPDYKGNEFVTFKKVAGLNIFKGVEFDPFNAERVGFVYSNIA